jgi:hypothetical protein
MVAGHAQREPPGVGVAGRALAAAAAEEDHVVPCRSYGDCKCHVAFGRTTLFSVSGLRVERKASSTVSRP